MNTMRTIFVVLLLAPVVLAACGDETESPTAPDKEILPEPYVFPYEEFYQQLQLDADQYVVEEGNWTEHYGDAPFWGPGFYVRTGVAEDRAEYLQRARAGRDHNLALVEAATGDILNAADEIEPVIMAMLGLIEYYDATGDDSVVEPVHDLLVIVDSLVQTFDNYLDVEIGAFAGNTYGPTAITGAFALVELQFAKYADGPAAEEWLVRAEGLADAIHDKSFVDGVYRFSPDEERLHLYPNAIMMLVNCRLFELTRQDRFLERAEAAFEAIQPLKDAEKGNYRSPYSAVTQGATTDDYATLSSQNYLSLALMLLYENSGDMRYLDEAHEVIQFIIDRLYDEEQGKTLHHWIDGHIAHPDDPSYFCTGCNLQLLYVLWYLRDVVGPAVVLEPTGT